MHDPVLQNSPRLPGLFKLPVKCLPQALRSRLFLASLNRLFRQELEDQELDFMQGRSVGISINDADLSFSFSLQDKCFVVGKPVPRCDLKIAGSLYDFLLLISRREDPDTLFFNRRLKLSGNTELGLYVKNFLDSVDLTERFQWLHSASLKASRLAEKFPLQGR
jgi:predicted lipid carrier protein YhbT